MKLLGKSDSRLGIISGGLVFYFFLIPLLVMDHFDHYLDDWGLWIAIPAIILFAVSFLYAKRKTQESAGEDQISQFLKQFVICMVQMILMGIISPLVIWRAESRTSTSQNECNAKTKEGELVAQQQEYLFPLQYANLDRDGIFAKLSRVSSSNDIKNAFSCFATERDGYDCCREWLNDQSKKKFEDKIRALFIAYYFEDKEFCNSIYAEGYVCGAKGVGSLLDIFCHSGGDDVVIRFIQRYTNSSERAKNEYAEHVPWYKYVKTDDDVAYRFYQSLGIRPKYTDDYHTICHRSGSMGSRRTSSYESETNLSKAIEQNDIQTIKRLVKWGVDPNQYLYCSYSYPDRERGILDSPTEKRNPNVYMNSHIITLIKTREVFDLLVAAGMDKTPPSSVTVIDGVRTVSSDTERCQFS